MKTIVSVFLYIVMCGVQIYSVSAQELKLNAKAAVIMDAESGKVLYGKSKDQKMPNASTTKILTCLYILEHCDIDQMAKVSKNASMQPKVRLGVREGESYKVKDLLYGLMLESYNDCAVVLAEYAAGSVEKFEKRVNQMAAKLGASNTHFVTPNGLDGTDKDGRHETTAQDLAKIMARCIKNQQFLEITQAKQHTFTDGSGKRTFTCNNHNALLSTMQGAISGKTGYTSKAGYCYVGAIKQKNMTMTVSVLASGWPPHKTYKWNDVRKLVQYVTDNYEKREIIADTNNVKEINVNNGLKQKVPLRTGNPKATFLIKKTDQIKIESILPSSMNAPVKKGQKVGEIRYLVNGKSQKNIPIYANQDVKQKDYWYYFEKIIQRFTLTL
ncbi:D-alanyl-D-alanine carboxypeptidase dacB precursor [uncultured Eubacterium sp.]|jgi:D-alanyl-D-alanine carboxypeptidase (penicillin-binding protein 5/6)|nr:D-alanyl-D-alanine carboxypeptidase family protein [uncultured Anaerostipes sp.]SCI57537.1 D-alanyl-D-alanine carboxypeptidase dacB precursor [uncultured Eubacterium sp.]